MAENAELQAKIAALAGRINRHKTVDTPPPVSHSQAHVPVGYGRGSNSWAPQRGTPYGIPRGRGWASRGTSHRHRTLVVNGPAQTGNVDPTIPPSSIGTTSLENAQSGWVSKRDRHMQLINTAVYEQKSQQRTQAMAATRKQRAEEKERREKAMLNTYLHSAAGRQHHVNPTVNSQGNAAHQITVDDIRYLATDGGSRLIKVTDTVNMLKTTPKVARIGGVTFLRSKHGNLYRAGFVKTKRLTDLKKISQPCLQFSTTGTCSKGPTCRYEHDPNKVAICRDFLQTGKCQAGLDCDLSHDPTAERVPACLHFLRGNCTNPECRYAHVRTNPGAPVCRAFATLGYCPKGASCEERHVYECPDFANKGFCRKKNCRLPHVHRAGQLRKAAAIQHNELDEGASSDVSSDDEFGANDSDDVDSDDFDEDHTIPDAQSHGLSQQDDFVKF